MQGSGSQFFNGYTLQVSINYLPLPDQLFQVMRFYFDKNNAGGIILSQNNKSGNFFLSLQQYR